MRSIEGSAEKTGIEAGQTTVAEGLKDVWQTAAFSLSATSPQMLSVRDIRTCVIVLSLVKAAAFQTAASGECGREASALFIL